MGTRGSMFPMSGAAVLAAGLACAFAGCGSPASGDHTPADAGTPLDVGLRWLAIPTGAFDMGCRQSDPYCDLDESPRHRVNVGRFFLSETLTTQQQYRDATGEAPSLSPECGATCP